MTTQSELTLPFILAEWEDESLANRAHVFIHMPSGTEEESVIKDPKVEGNFLQFSIRWPQAITSLDTMFGHSRFTKGYHHRGNSIVKTITKCINKSAGGSGYIESIVKIPLPEATGPFEFTPDEISGHFCFEPIIREHRTISAKSCLIFMFDL